jgi:hypothetical protein
MSSRIEKHYTDTPSFAIVRIETAGGADAKFAITMTGNDNRTAYNTFDAKSLRTILTQVESALTGT